LIKIKLGDEEMFLKKKGLAMLMAITVVLLLAACGGEESAEEEPVQDGSQDSSPDPMPISEGLEEYSVWIEAFASDGIDRNSRVRGVYIFENGEATHYYNISDEDKLKIEEINDLTDDEIIQYVKEVATMKDSGKYTLDITLDSLGQHTENMEVVLTSGTEVRTTDLENVVADISGSTAWINYGLNEKYPNADAYLEALRNGEDELPNTNEKLTTEVNGDEVIYTTQIEHKNIITLEPGIIQQTIFDTTYSGLSIGDYDRLITRVDDSFMGFELDDPDTDKENVTIEGAEESEKQSKKEQGQEDAPDTSAEDDDNSSLSDSDDPLQAAKNEKEEEEAKEVKDDAQEFADEIEHIMKLVEEGKLEEAALRKEQLTEQIDLSQQVKSEDYNSSIRALDDMIVAAKYEKEQAAENNSSNQDSSSGNGLKDTYLSKARELDARIDKKHNGDVGIGVYGDYFDDWDGLLNEVWNELEDTMPKDEFEDLKQDQRAWVKEKDAHYEKWSNEIDAKDVLTNTTRERTYYLIENYME